MTAAHSASRKRFLEPRASSFPLWSDVAGMVYDWEPVGLEAVGRKGTMKVTIAIVLQGLLTSWNKSKDL